MTISIETLNQVTKGNSPWHLYENENGYLYSVAVKEGYGNSSYGNFVHLISIMYKYGGYKKEDFTEYGWQLIVDYLKTYNFKESDLFKS